MGSKENIERLYVEWQSLQPISEEAQNNINRKFMLEFNYNSNHIEGNTLTYGQTEFLFMLSQVYVNTYTLLELRMSTPR